MTNHFSLSISYSQIAVFQVSLKNPFNDWTDQHVAQGFSWRPGSVSFRTLSEAGPVEVEISRASKFTADDGAVRAIVVPFVIPEKETIGIGSIADEHKLDIPSGTYALYFEMGRDREREWIRFTFVPADSVEPKVIRADSALSPQYPLSMSAEPA